MAELGAAQTEQANICNKEQAQVQRVNSKNIISIINSNVFMYRHIHFIHNAQHGSITGMILNLLYLYTANVSY